MLIYILLVELVFAYDVIIKINDGSIGGDILKDYEGNNYLSFQSIPFAKPPIGNLRFKAPVKITAWDGVLNGTREAPSCPQVAETRVGQEDCLYLNVYTPMTCIKINLPVMFFIHGGLFQEGSGSRARFGPEYLMTEKIVLVTINYRLGYLGGLSFKNDSYKIPGNAHMKDQVVALKWVQENIKQFGGNPNMVTIFGESSGGGSVNLHMLSPMSKGLFHRAISESGYALTPWMQGNLGSGEVLAKKLGINLDSEENVINKLQNISVWEILDKQDKKKINRFDERRLYMPVVEIQTYEPAFLQKLPIDIIKSGNFMKVPYIMGYNNKECIHTHALSYAYLGKPYCPKDFTKYIPFNVKVKSEKDKEKIVNGLQKVFASNNGSDDIEVCTDLCTGSWYIAPFYRTLVLMMEKSNEPIFAYRFSADTNLNVYKKQNPFTADMKGAGHLDELGYLFTTQFNTKIEQGSKEEIVMKTMVKLWTNFAKTGRSHAKWLPVEKCKLNSLEININSQLKTNTTDAKIIDFWATVYKIYNGDMTLCDI